MADAFLEVAGVQIPVHKAILALASPVFATAFEAAAKTAHTVQGGSPKLVVPITDTAVADVRAALSFLYQRNGATQTDPHDILRKSAGTAEPTLKFAHKYDMQAILSSCDRFLSSQSTVLDGKFLFPDANATIAWTYLADHCGLSALSAQAELHIVKHSDTALWKSHAFDKHHLSQSCFLRILRAAQVHKDACNKTLEEFGLKQGISANARLCCDMHAVYKATACPSVSFLKSLQSKPMW